MYIYYSKNHPMVLTLYFMLSLVMHQDGYWMIKTWSIKILILQKVLKIIYYSSLRISSTTCNNLFKIFRNIYLKKKIIK